MEILELDNSYGLATLQGELLEIMKYIHSTCENNGIIYSLTGGSLLGAIRHDGFIPWDDDFDIMFDRENYEKFIGYMRKNPSNQYILEQDQWVYRVRKEHKVKGFVPSIDLFVLDQTPKNRFANKIQILLLRILQGMLRNNESEIHQSAFYRFCIWMTAKMGILFSDKTLFSWYDKVSQWGNRTSSDQLSIFDDRFQLLPLKYSKGLIDRVEFHTFADTKFLIVSDYKQYLSLQYGDYMMLPPKKDRVPQHMF